MSRTVAVRTVDCSTSGFTMLSHRQQQGLFPLLDNRLLSAVNHHMPLLKPADGSWALSVSGTVVRRRGGSTRHYWDLAILQRSWLKGQPCVCSGPLCSSLSCCRLWWDRTTWWQEHWLVDLEKMTQTVILLSVTTNDYFLNEIIVLSVFADLNGQDFIVCCFSGCIYSFWHFIHCCNVPLSVCTNRGLADGHVHIQLLGNRHRWQHGFPGEISVTLSLQTFSLSVCGCIACFKLIGECVLLCPEATLSSSPMSPPNEAKPQWTTLSLPTCTLGMLREVYASSPSPPTSLGTRWATTGTQNCVQLKFQNHTFCLICILLLVKQWLLFFCFVCLFVCLAL